MARATDLFWALRTCEPDCRILIEDGVLYKLAPVEGGTVIGRKLVACFESGYWLEKMIGGYAKAMKMKAG